MVDTQSVGRSDATAAPMFVLTDVATPVLRDVQLEIPAGQTTVIVGPSGSGKSSLLRLLNVLDRADAGTVRHAGQPIEAEPPQIVRRRVGMVFQRPTVFDGTVAENLRVARPDATDADVMSMLERVGLDGGLAARDARTLSGGEAQRVCLARTLATDPSVLLLDEPTSALDTDSVHIIEHLVRSFVDEGGTVVWVSHDQEQVRRVADHLVRLVEGTVVESGPHDAMGHIHSDDSIWRTAEEG